MEGRYIVYKTNKVVRRVNFDEILYVESDGRQIKLETECGTLSYYEKISAIAPSFDDSFCKGHVILLYQLIKSETHVRWNS